MAHLLLFGQQIEFILLLQLHLDRHTLDDLEIKCSKAVDLLRVVGHQTQFMYAQVLQDLGTNGIVTHIRRESQHNVGFDGIVTFILQGIGSDLVDQSNAAAFLSEVKQYTAAFLFNHAQSGLKLFAAVAFIRSESITGQAFRMNTAENRFAIADLTLDQGDMMLACQLIDIAVDNKFTVFCRKFGFGHTLYQFFVLFTPALDLLDRRHLQIMLFCKFHKVIISCHVPVIIHDLTAQAHLLKACHLHQVNGNFCMTVSFEDAARLGDQREHVTRTPEVLRLCIFSYCPHRGLGTFIGRYTRCRIHIVDRFGKCRTVIICIVCYHHIDAKFFHIILMHGHADQAFGIGGHEINVLRRSKFCCADHVTFIFSVLVIHDDNTFSFLQVS